MDRMVGIRLPSSTRNMAWLHHRIPAGSRVHLVPWSACLIGWTCGIFSGRQLAWYSAHTRRWDLVGGGVQATDNWVGTHLPGATEGTGPVQGVREGDGGGIFGGAQDNTSWASGRGKTEL